MEFNTTTIDHATLLRQTELVRTAVQASKPSASTQVREDWNGLLNMLEALGDTVAREMKEQTILIEVNTHGSVENVRNVPRGWRFEIVPPSVKPSRRKS